MFVVLDRQGYGLYSFSEGKTLVAFLAVAFSVAAAYQLIILAIAGLFRLQHRDHSEVLMLSSLFRVAGILVIATLLFSFFGMLPTSWAAVAGFAGLLMGWSLQAPVSGVTAWVMVNIKRPFRVGDRVMLPSLGLTGDVTSIGMMYIVLNQVGGTVGSEEAAGRDILIPNAMLFSNIVINFTPKQSAAYVLDEVIVRITYNSNWDLAEKILTEAATEVTGDIVQITGQTPYIRADLYDYGVYMRLRYMTSATDRPRISYEITKLIFKEFSEHPDIDFAIPFVFSHRAGLRAAVRNLEPPPSAPSGQLEVAIDQVFDPTGYAENPQSAAEVKMLAEKISQMGLLQPIVVEQRPDGRYNAVAGQLRLAACKMLGWKTIPAIVRPQH